MRNAMTELMEFAEVLTVDCLNIVYHYDDEPKVFRAENHEQFLKILPQLNFEYDNGYGGQSLFGLVLFTDGSWLERGEYDGSEWWEHRHALKREDVLGKDETP